MKNTILNMFAAKKFYIEFDSHLYDAIMDKQTAEIDLTLEIKNEQNEEVRVEVKVFLNYFLGQYIDTNLLELIYTDHSGNQHDLSNDLQIDLAFDKFIHSLYTF